MRDLLPKVGCWTNAEKEYAKYHFIEVVKSHLESIAKNQYWLGERNKLAEILLAVLSEEEQAKIGAEIESLHDRYRK